MEIPLFSSPLKIVLFTRNQNSFSESNQWWWLPISAKISQLIFFFSESRKETLRQDFAINLIIKTSSFQLKVKVCIDELLLNVKFKKLFKLIVRLWYSKTKRRIEIFSWSFLWLNHTVISLVHLFILLMTFENGIRKDDKKYFNGVRHMCDRSRIISVNEQSIEEKRRHLWCAKKLYGADSLGPKLSTRFFSVDCGIAAYRI